MAEIEPDEGFIDPDEVDPERWRWDPFPGDIETYIVPGAAEVTVFHLAACRVCTPSLPQPFYDFDKREDWAKAHSAVHDDISRTTEIRIRKRPW